MTTGKQEDDSLDPTVARIRAELWEFEDRAYRAFMIKCNPEAEHSIGVRIPIIHKIAKQLLRGDYLVYIEAPGKEYFEEIMLEGILIATAPIALAERLRYLENYVPKLYDWCVCDTVCSAFRRALPTATERNKMWNFLLRYQKSDREFELRFMLVMIKCYFIDAEHLPDIFRILDNIDDSQHYVSMGAAWLLAELIARERNAAFQYLPTSNLSSQTFNKGLQKACESYRVAPVDKKVLRGMKRK